MKYITFITTGQPTTNPRLVKEVETLIGLNYQVKVVCCYYYQWATVYDRELTDRYPGTFIYCGGRPESQRWRYWWTRIRQKVNFWLYKFSDRWGIAERAISRTHAEALSIARRLRTDLYIAHNLGALPAAVKAAKSRRVKVGYDAEDLHSAQFFEDTDQLYLLNKHIEEKYFPETHYFSAASPLIASHYREIYPYLHPVVINNVFPKSLISPYQPKKKDGPLTLFWFSQTIGPDRGIEDIIAAMGLTGISTELHLLGQCADVNRTMFDQLAESHGLHKDQLQFHSPMAPADLFQFAAGFHIGMATETGQPFNREICLTNKIFTYMQSGLLLIASDTRAQADFISQHPGSGEIYSRNAIAGLATLFRKYHAQRSLLEAHAKSNYYLGQTVMNWENESTIFLKLVEELI